MYKITNTHRRLLMQLHVLNTIKTMHGNLIFLAEHAPLNPKHKKYKRMQVLIAKLALLGIETRNWP